MFQECIREHYNSLTPGFRSIADFITNNTFKAAFFTVRELAYTLNVDSAVVVSFSQEIGYSSYDELSREIKNYVQNQISITHRPAESARQEEALLLTLQENLMQNLQRFFATESKNLIHATRLLSQASHVWIVGEFISYDLAQLFARELNLIGIPATTVSPSMTESAVELTHIQSGDVMFAIAVASAGIDTGYTVKLARERGVKTICLTSFDTSLAAREAEIVIVTPTVGPAGFATFDIATMSISFIWELLMALNPENTAQAFIQTFDNISVLRDLRVETSRRELRH